MDGNMQLPQNHLLKKLFSWEYAIVPEPLVEKVLFPMKYQLIKYVKN